MGSKNVGKRETKKPAKPQPKPAPGRRREDAISTPATINKKP